jgi:AcrR family transcriptional regulator
MKQKEDRRAQILQAAFEAFAEKGYDKTSMDDIVKRSGTSKGTLYWHFKNKKDLFLATINMLLGDLNTGAQALAQQEDLPAADRLRLLFSEATQGFLEDRKMIGLFANAFFHSYQNAEARQMMMDAYRPFIDWAAQIVQQGIDRGEFRAVNPMTAAAAMVGGGDGIMFDALLEPGWDAREVMTMLIDLMLGGLQKEQQHQ